MEILDETQQQEQQQKQRIYCFKCKVELMNSISFNTQKKKKKLIRKRKPKKKPIVFRLRKNKNTGRFELIDSKTSRSSSKVNNQMKFKSNRSSLKFPRFIGRKQSVSRLQVA